ncbi:MAG: hypothetical protein E6F97_02360 [Actinobacteria bacterium]|nr:MAG: hypothetical protein E6F97_02360 [Actinomycetota bacterium]
MRARCKCGSRRRSRPRAASKWRLWTSSSRRSSDGGTARRAADGADPALPVGRHRPGASVAVRGRGRRLRALPRGARRIDEAVTLAKRYSSEDAGRLVNGILGKIVQETRA